MVFLSGLMCQRRFFIAYSSEPAYESIFLMGLYYYNKYYILCVDENHRIDIVFFIIDENGFFWYDIFDRFL